MGVDAELGIFKPLWGGMLDKRIPGGFKKLMSIHLVNLLFLDIKLLKT
jgi:hypothetical protein